MSDYFSPTGSELNTGNGENIPKQGEMIGKCNGIRTGQDTPDSDHMGNGAEWDGSHVWEKL